MRRLIKVFSLVIFNLILTLFLIEIALRFLPLPSGFSVYLKAVGMIQEQQSAYIKDPVGGLSVFKPNISFTWTIMDGEWQITTVPFPDDKRLGLRDDGIDESAEVSVFACGDSFTFGFGVDNNQVWHEVLENKYNGEVDIFSLRAIGNSIPDIYDAYPQYRDRFKHDVVFLNIYLGNEFIEAYFKGQSSKQTAQVVALQGEQERRGSQIVESSEQSVTAVAYEMIRKSYAARIVKYLFFNQWVKLGYTRIDSKREVFQPEDSPYVFTIDYEDYLLVRNCEVEYSETLQSGVEFFSRRLQQLVEMIRQDNRRVYVFIFPFKEQVYWDQWSYRLETPERYDRFKPNYIVREQLERLNVPYYDLTDDLIDQGEGEILYWPIDSHWTAAGNRLAADLIYTWLAGREEWRP